MRSSSSGVAPSASVAAPRTRPGSPTNATSSSVTRAPAASGGASTCNEPYPARVKRTVHSPGGSSNAYAPSSPVSCVLPAMPTTSTRMPPCELASASRATPSMMPRVSPWKNGSTPILTTSPTGTVTSCENDTKPSSTNVGSSR